MKTCRICGAANGNDASACCACGIGFARVQDSAIAGMEGNQEKVGGRLSVGFLMACTIGIVAAGAVVVIFDRRSEKSMSRSSDAPVPTLVCRDETEDLVQMGERISSEHSSGNGTVPRANPLSSLFEKHPDLKKFLEAEKTVQVDNPYWNRHPPYDLGVEFGGDAKEWRVNWEEFLRRHPRIWYSTDGESRHSIQGNCVSFFDYSICENVLVFGRDGLERIELSVFNKGVMGTVLSESGAMDVLNRVTSKVAADNVARFSSDDGAGMSITRYEWSGSYPVVRASIGERILGGERCVEYLNFILTLHDVESTAPAKDLKENIRRAGQDVYIEGVPMVNQGRKGYCVPATISRLLQYYGIDADMHELALVMETECGGGTKIGGDFPTLSRIASETGLERRDYRNFEKYDDAYIERYNAAARANGGRELKIEDFTVEETDADGGVVEMRHYDWLVDAMDAELKRKSRHYDTVGYATFRNGILSSVNDGCPVIWSVDRLFPWDRSDGWSGTGHMRLIVGYNAEANEILYSDSWGSGNEFKRASISEAWEVTDFMSCLRPTTTKAP